MTKTICIGYFKDFSGEDSILISVDIYGLLEIENVFLQLANGLSKFDFTDLPLLDKKHKIELIAYNYQQNTGLQKCNNQKYEWRLTQNKWNEFRQKTTEIYRCADKGHQYLDSNSFQNNDLQVILSLNEYDLEFWQKFDDEKE